MVVMPRACNMPTNSVTAYFINGLADESLEIRRFMVGLKSIFLSVSKILSKYDNWFSIPAIKGLVTLILVAGYLLPPTPSLSSNLKLEIEHLLKYDHRIKEQEKIVNVSDLNFTATRLTKFPTLSLTSNLTREKLTNNAAEATLLNARDVDATLTFPVIDKSLDESVNTAELSAELSSISKDTVVNGILLEAVSAYINLISSEKFLDYSIKSVENIKEQTELQDAKIAIGTGLTSNLLQAKTQLAAAEARKSQAELGYNQAKVAYESLFGRIPDTPLEEVYFDPSWLPKILEDCIKIAIENNSSYALQRKNYEIIKSQEYLQRNTQFIPKLNLILNGKWKYDFSGSKGFERDLSAKLQLTYSFNIGGSGIYLYGAAKSSTEATVFNDVQARINLERSIRSAWNQYNFSRENTEFLNSQLELSEQFLELARREQSLGKRSLLDVLTGETSEINAASDYYVAESIQKLSGYTLLDLMGQLPTYLE
jgi:outer membrane protein TolC